MISQNLLDRLGERYGKLCKRDYANTKKVTTHKDGTRTTSYTLSWEAEECWRIIRMASKPNLTADEEREVKVYHIKYCIEGDDGV